MTEAFARQSYGSARALQNLRPVIWYGGLALAAFSAAYLTRDFDWAVVWKNREFLLKGLGVSWLIAITGIVLGLVFGIILATGRRYGAWPIRRASAVFIELIRSIPHLMIFLWVFFVYPEIVGEFLSPNFASVIALTIIAAAYLAEVIRAGLDSVDRIQRESGHATGLSSTQTFFWIMLPQALRNMVPALIATFVMVFKITTFVYVLGMVDFFNAVVIVNRQDLAPFSLYTTMAIVYFICCWLLSRFVRWIDPKYTLVN